MVSGDDYYPFGLTFNSYKDGSDNKYLYNQGTGEKTFNTERQPELGLDMTKFRMYDYALGRFISIDPKADQAEQESWTPYHYGVNNPIRYSDPFCDCATCGPFFAVQSAKYTAILTPAIEPLKNLFSGQSGDVPSHVDMSSREQKIFKVAGVAQDGAKVNEVKENLENELQKDAGKMTQAAGDAVQIAGIVTLQPEMVVLGERMSWAGMALEMSGNEEFDAKKAGYEVAKKLVTGKASKVGEDAVKVGDLEAVANSVYQGTIYTWGKISDFFYQKTTDD